MKEFRKLNGTNWEFNKDGNALYNGISKEILTGKIYYKNNMIDISVIIQQLFKDVENKTNTKQHGNKGKKRSNSVKIAISKANSKSIVIDGKSYNSIKDAAKDLNINRSTIYRINKKALTT